MSDINPIEALRELESEALAAIAEAGDADSLEQVRVTYLGRSEGRISAILRGLGRLSPEERPAVGQTANRVKLAVSQALEARQAAHGGPAVTEARDLTLPAREPWKGGPHPITQAVD